MADEFKGRVFVIYDVIFNVTLVVAAVIGAVILPANGKSVIILVVMAVGYLLIALGFALISRGLSMNEGTESLQAAPDTSCKLISASASRTRSGRRRDARRSELLRCRPCRHHRVRNQTVRCSPASDRDAPTWG